MSPGGLPRQKVASVGETIAALELERRGWTVHATNYRCKQGEIDIIAEAPTKGGKTLVFVEVKTRRGISHGSPIEAVTARKQARIVAVAQVYLAERRPNETDLRCRFDIAEVLFTPDGYAKVTLHEGAFGAT